MRIFITAATYKEYEQCLKTFNSITSPHQIIFCTTGVGMLSSTVSLTEVALKENPDLIIQVGIAGTFDKQKSLGEVVAVSKEYIADMGVEENNIWKDIFDLSLQNTDDDPFEQSCLPNPHLNKFNFLNLEEVSAITINEITTNEQRIKQYVSKYQPIIESMEGAALHYVGRKFNIPFIQIRAISNFVGERNKTKWKLKEALNNLNEALLNYLHQIQNL